MNPDRAVLSAPPMTAKEESELREAWKAASTSPSCERSTARPADEADSFIDAMFRVAALPAEGLAFVVMTPPADGIDGALLAAKGPLGVLSQRLRAVNPSAHLLVLPAGWSFRTMDRTQSREFAANMLAFVPDEDLAAVRLRRTDETDRVESSPIPDSCRHLLPGEVLARLQALDPSVGTIRIKTVYANGDPPSMTVRTTGRVPDDVQDTLAAQVAPNVRLVFKDDKGYARAARTSSRVGKESAGV